MPNLQLLAATAEKHLQRCFDAAPGVATGRVNPLSVLFRHGRLCLHSGRRLGSAVLFARPFSTKTKYRRQ